MLDIRRQLFAAGLLMSLAAAASAEDKCLVKAVLGGKSVTLKYCEVAMYDEKGVTLSLGGNLTGRITGAKTSDGLSYSWQADFDVQLPAKAAAAGLSCGS
jgi:hypothetical protein